MRVSGSDVLDSLEPKDSQASSENGGDSAKVQKVGIDAVDARNYLNLRDSVLGFQGMLYAQAQGAQGVPSVSPQNPLSGAPSSAARLPTGPAPLLFQ
jgi:hypothetical protein